MSKHMGRAICTQGCAHASLHVSAGACASLCQRQISGRQLLLPLPHKQQALSLPSAGFALFLALLSCLPANMHSLYLLSPAASPLLPKLMLLNQANCLPEPGAVVGRAGRTERCSEQPAPCAKAHSCPFQTNNNVAQLGTPERPRTTQSECPMPFLTALAYSGLHCIEHTSKSS